MKKIAEKNSKRLKSNSTNLPKTITQDSLIEAFKKVTGTKCETLALDILERSAYAIPGYDKEKQTKILYEFLNEIKPQNAIEGMLCAQLALLHFQGIQYLGSAENADWRQHTESDLNAAIKLCHLHGGKSTGAKTKAGKLRQKMASWKHGRRSKEAIEKTKFLKRLLKGCKERLKA